MYRTEYLRLSRLAAAIVRDDQLGEDLVAEGMVRLVEHWDRVKTYDAPGAWLRRVVIREAARHQRKRAHDCRTFSAMSARVQVADPGPEVQSPLRQAIDSLPSSMRAVVLVYYFMDKSIVETASLLGIKEGTVKAQLHNARRRLEQEMTLLPTEAQ